MFGWAPTKEMERNHEILGYSCLVANYSKRFVYADRDYILPGKYGAIWNYSADKYFILITSAVIANRYLKLKGKDRMVAGEEKGVIVDKIEAKKWTKIIKVPKSAKIQLKYIERITK